MTKSSWSPLRRPLDRCVAAASLVAVAAAPAMAQSSHDSCVDVKVGSAESYACLNQKLGAEAAQAHAAASGEAPYDAKSPGQVTGQFNESATRNRLGANFGHSVTPQRPTASPPPR